MSQSLKYYVYVDESVQGPHDIDYIKSMNLTGSTKICPEGSTEWTSLENLNISRRNSDMLADLSADYSSDYMPTKIGKYNIVNEIGRGGMGSVYLALDEILNRKVAVKELKIDEHKKRDSEAYSTMIRRFKKEAQILAQLNHKNIVSVFDIIEQNQNQYIIMEYLDGGNLEEKLNSQGSLQLAEAVSIIADVCLALDYIHKKSIVHRDIKPSNIVILSDGVVKLTDFGVTRDLNSATLTMDGSLVGTIAYASPEQDSRDLDGRSDIFSLGVVLYELVTGQKPFTGDTIASVLLKIATKDPVRPTEINPRIHRMLENIILKAMAKSLSQRYASAMDMHNDLMAYKAALEENNFNLLAGQKQAENIFQNSNKIDSIPPGKVQAKDIFKHSIPPGKLTMNDMVAQAKITEPPMNVTQPPTNKPLLNTSTNNKSPYTKLSINTSTNNEKAVNEVKTYDNPTKNTGNLTEKITTGNLENKLPTADIPKSEKGTQNKLKQPTKVEENKIKPYIFPGIITLLSLIAFFAGILNLFDIGLVIGTVWGMHYDYNKTNVIKPLSYILILTSIFVIFFSAKLIIPSFDNSKISTAVYYILDVLIFLISILGSYFLVKTLDALSLNKDKSKRPVSTIVRAIFTALSIILIISCTSMVTTPFIKNQFEKSKITNALTFMYKDFKPGKKLNVSTGKFGLKIGK